MEWTDDAAVPLCRGEVGDVEGVLGPDVAADVAVAEVDAGALLLALRVDERRRVAAMERIVELVVPVRRERHREGRL